MSFYEIYSKYKRTANIFDSVQSRDVERAISAEALGADDLLALLSPAAEDHLEVMASKAHEATLQYFGRAIQLYTPLYLSNYCENKCAYCGFSAANKIKRQCLSLEEVEREAVTIASTGLKHILVLTGESRSKSPLSYIINSVKILKKYFNSIAVEIYALTKAEYGELISVGVDGLTIYQEVYDEEIYKAMHSSGPKSDYAFRLNAPQRGAEAGMRSVNIGALLGLNDWRREAFYLGLHARYLQDMFPETEIGVSLPRLRPHEGSFKILHKVDDKALVQILVALRIFLPRLGISLSTRESADLRENLIPLGVTRMSAGSSTYVGGHTIDGAGKGDKPQFEISDKRNVVEMMAVLQSKGYQPVLKDWLNI